MEASHSMIAMDQIRPLERDEGSPRPSGPLLVRRQSLGLSRSDPNLNAILEFNRSWKDKMRLPSDIIHTQIIQNKTLDLKEDLDKLEELTRCLAESAALDVRDEDQLEETVIRIMESIASILDYINILSHRRLSSKQDKVVQAIRNKYDLATDISIPFLGLDWAHMGDLVASLLSHVNEVSCRIIGSNGQHGVGFNLRMVCNVVQDLRRIKNDVLCHAEAVFEGRLNSRNREDMRIEQHRHRDLLQILAKQKTPLYKEYGHPNGPQKLGPRLRQLLRSKKRTLFKVKNSGPTSRPLGDASEPNKSSNEANGQEDKASEDESKGMPNKWASWSDEVDHPRENTTTRRSQDAGR